MGLNWEAGGPTPHDSETSQPSDRGRTGSEREKRLIEREHSLGMQPEVTRQWQRGMRIERGKGNLGKGFWESVTEK